MYGKPEACVRVQTAAEMFDIVVVLSPFKCSNVQMFKCSNVQIGEFKKESGNLYKLKSNTAGTIM